MSEDVQTSNVDSNKTKSLQLWLIIKEHRVMR